MDEIKNVKISASQIIKCILESKPETYLAVHEIVNIARADGYYMNENAAASRLCIDLKGVAQGRVRQGKRFKEWAIL